MQNFQRILVAVDCNQPDCDEFVRAKALAQANGATLHIVDVLRDLNVAARLMPGWQEAHEKIAAEKTAALELLVKLCQDKGIECSYQLLHGNYSVQLIALVQGREIDLLVRSAKGEHSAESGAIGATSYQLLRKAPCALWLTQGPQASSCQRILAAIDATPEDETHAQLNRTILGRSQQLVSQTGCHLDVAYAWDIFDSELLRNRVPADEFAEMIERNKLCHAEAYDRQLSPFGLHAADVNVHMLRGPAIQVIPEFCQQRSIDLLVCGTVARVGISGLMIGNTANRMFSRVPCSILALR